MSKSEEGLTRVGQYRILRVFVLIQRKIIFDSSLQEMYYISYKSEIHSCKY